ncbi:hypothetical protein BJ684DRAFT_20448 [Piptocephalis cylindrospora]|uniref:Uncharacterized protein n=1 Tax=Piptocephalis cylindrospora TaxID=1907219 RepID=A0A4P9Y4H0_9FUNG|nr:hypothetical protein BJ684DRAFT_20448 [Piptocephalis cylindrospora]|eukprot:RKP13041.1 hypothetical protein BJ684DRAFT_20448 [Piptocephalis cylindrospora]
MHSSRLQPRLSSPPETSSHDPPPPQKPYLPNLHIPLPSPSPPPSAYLSPTLSATSRSPSPATLDQSKVSTTLPERIGPARTFWLYVSGHGFGHATRASALASALLQHGHHLHIITQAPSFLFPSPSASCTYRVGAVDPGVVQPLPYVIDADATFAGLANFLQPDYVQEWMKRETALLRLHSPAALLLDAPFLPALAAQSLSIPAFIVSNFTFDAVYAHLIRDIQDPALLAQAPRLVAQVTQAYQAAQGLFRLPGHIPTPIPPTVDLPLISRVPHLSRATVRARLGLQAGMTPRLLLVTFGGQRVGEDGWGALRVPQGWVALLCGVSPSSLPPTLPKGFMCADQKAYVPDLVGAADAVLGKLGFGTCAEVLACGTPLIYVRRAQFAEEEGLLRLMDDRAHPAVEMLREEFEDGLWDRAIRKALSEVGDKGKVPGWEVGGGELSAISTLEELLWRKDDENKKKGGAAMVELLDESINAGQMIPNA